MMQLDTMQLIGIITGVVAGIVAFWKGIDYLWDKVRHKFDKDYKSKHDRDVILDKLAEHELQWDINSEEFRKLQTEVLNWKEMIENKINKQDEKIDILLKADLNDIKSWIVREYIYFAQTLGHIDPYSLDAIEQRYADYQREGGNSYVSTLIEELRHLPKRAFEEMQETQRNRV